MRKNETDTRKDECDTWKHKESKRDPCKNEINKKRNLGKIKQAKMTHIREKESKSNTYERKSDNWETHPKYGAFAPTSERMLLLFQQCTKLKSKRWI